MKPEDQEERFGEMAQRKGYISWLELLEGLELQIERTQKKESIDSSVKYCVI
jgi:hypothetical protein